MERTQTDDTQRKSITNAQTCWPSCSRPSSPRWISSRQSGWSLPVGWRTKNKKTKNKTRNKSRYQATGRYNLWLRTTRIAEAYRTLCNLHQGSVRLASQTTWQFLPKLLTSPHHLTWASLLRCEERIRAGSPALLTENALACWTIPSVKCYTGVPMACAGCYIAHSTHSFLWRQFQGGKKYKMRPKENNLGPAAILFAVSGKFRQLFYAFQRA